MRYFKRPDGSVFGKLDSIKKKVVTEFQKKDYMECDENGVPLKPKKKSASKKSEN